MSQTSEKRAYDFSDRSKYDALMGVVRNRMTVRAFDPGYTVPREHYEWILDAARHSPSGANAQPWHFIVVTNQALKSQIAEYFREEQVVRAKLKMKFPTPDYRGLATAPGFIVIASDFRWVRAFPVLNDGSALDSMYKENAERILLQSVAAATMSAHLAAAALGYNALVRANKNIVSRLNRFGYDLHAYFLTGTRVGEAAVTHAPTRLEAVSAAKV